MRPHPKYRAGSAFSGRRTIRYRDPVTLRNAYRGCRYREPRTSPGKVPRNT